MEEERGEGGRWGERVRGRKLEGGGEGGREREGGGGRGGRGGKREGKREKA